GLHGRKDAGLGLRCRRQGHAVLRERWKQTNRLVHDASPLGWDDATGLYDSPWSDELPVREQSVAVYGGAWRTDAFFLGNALAERSHQSSRIFPCSNYKCLDHGAQRLPELFPKHLWIHRAGEPSRSERWDCGASGG